MKAQSGGANKLQFALKNELGEIAAAKGRCEEFLDQRGVPMKAGRQLLVALDELLNNIISYAYPEPGAHEIGVTVAVLKNQVRVTVQDDGVPFNPLARRVPDTDASLGDRELGGLGIHLVRNMLDDVHYERRGSRNVLTLVRTLKQIPDSSKPTPD